MTPPLAGCEERGASPRLFSGGLTTCPERRNMENPMRDYSRAEIDRLGSRLRKMARPEGEDISLYVDWSRSFGAALEEIESELDSRAGRIEQSGGFLRSSRIKQIGSVAAKLRRMRTKLSGLEDIAGCRVVVPTPNDVDQLLVECVTLCVSRVRDYRVLPHNGYRALHLIVRADDGKPIELPLRTRAQHAWANLTERFASILDPDLKYGGGSAQERSLLDQFSFLGTPRRSIATSFLGRPIVRRRRQGDAKGEGGYGRGTRRDRAAARSTGDELMMEVERFVKLCKSLYPSGGMES